MIVCCAAVSPEEFHDSDFVQSRLYAAARFLMLAHAQEETMGHEDSLTRREFTVQSALAMLAGVTITISGCGSDNNPTPAPSPMPTDKTGTVSTDAGHSHTGAVVTAAQFAAGNAITLTLTGSGHTHTATLSQPELTQISAGTRVQKTSSTDNAHMHTVTFN